MTDTEIEKIFRRLPALRTERLLLRHMRVRDSADMFDYARRPEVTRYLLWNCHRTEEQTRRYLRHIERERRFGRICDWAIVMNGRMIGSCGFVSIKPTGEAEVGYVLSPDYWHRGIAPEALAAVIAFGFERLGLSSIEARFMSGNKPSRRVMEKCGMVYQGMKHDAIIVRGEWRDVGCCVIKKSQYSPSSKRPYRPAKWYEKLL